MAKAGRTKDVPDQAFPPDLMGLSTDFDVNVVVKGDKDLKHIVLHHYRFANAKDRLIPDAPELVSFAPSKTKSWLLFLQKEADGRYAPINGQVDPAECAVSPADSIDLVVIAKPVSVKKQVDGDERTWSGISPTVHLVGYRTEFAVQDVLKGDKSARSFVLHHYEHTGNPQLIDYQPIDYQPDPNRVYLLLLNKEAAEIFRPNPGSYMATTPDGFPVIELGGAPK